ncbi:hypothetical protein Z969_08915 [Clostridium novyi A str. 4570]|uniref:ParB/Sulfiredoxin domain-containing protein n=1 Tax=Clostridium novyi A str. 4570 TaxID=1444290 RepID=A0AA89CLN9_CLONO|nr:hypothetical protein [Clostridium novyi]KGN00965.1 hypothetical protein Z969_08915 [Clostridium novyi A str. 4570]
MPNIFEMKLLDVQPSQLFISKTKLENVLKWLNVDSINKCDPIPVKNLNGKVIFTDGHTRAFAMYKMGIENIKVYWDEDELDWRVYEICVDWCTKDGIKSISHLDQRVISNDEYEILWYERCRKMQRGLEDRQFKIDDV